MKKSELTFSFLLVPLDFLMITLAAVSAYQLRFAEFTAGIRPVIFNLPFEYYLKIVIFVAVFWLIIFALAGLYHVSVATRITSEMYRVILACSTGLVAVIIFMFFRRELFSSRFIILAAWGLAIIYVVCARIMMRWLQRRLYAQGIGVHKIIVIGNTPTTERVITLISSSHKLGYEIFRRFKVLDAPALKELRELAERKKIDEIIQIDPNLSKSDVLNLFSICDEYHLTFKYAADLLGTKILQTEVIMMAGLPIVEIKTTPLDGWGRIIKRIFDVIAALISLATVSPILILVALLVKLESRGPIIYKNERVSKNGIFTTYKFRSMYLQYCIGEEYKNSEAALKLEAELIARQNTKEGPVYKIANDPRLTKIGRLIRRWSLDELPQLVNVLAGTMSMVGPRPHQPREVAKYAKHHKKVLAIKPGVTGLAQISGRSDLSFEEEVRLDTYYIENWSLRFDLNIIFKTPVAILRKRRVV